MKSIIDFSLRNKAIVLLGALALLVAGFFAVRNIPLDAMPDLSPSSSSGAPAVCAGRQLPTPHGSPKHWRLLEMPC